MCSNSTRFVAFAPQSSGSDEALNAIVLAVIAEPGLSLLAKIVDVPNLLGRLPAVFFRQAEHQENAPRVGNQGLPEPILFEQSRENQSTLLGSDGLGFRVGRCRRAVAEH